MKLRVSCVWCLVYLGFGCERYGKKEGFSNEEKKKVHDAATKIQQKTDVSIHENVPDYEEDSLSFLYSYMGVQLLDHWRNSWTLTWRPMTAKQCCKSLIAGGFFKNDTKQQINCWVVSASTQAGPTNVWASKWTRAKLEDLLPVTQQEMELSLFPGWFGPEAVSSYELQPWTQPFCLFAGTKLHAASSSAALEGLPQGLAWEECVWS